MMSVFPEEDAVVVEPSSSIRGCEARHIRAHPANKGRAGTDRAHVCMLSSAYGDAFSVSLSNR